MSAIEGVAETPLAPAAWSARRLLVVEAAPSLDRTKLEAVADAPVDMSNETTEAGPRL